MVFTVGLAVAAALATACGGSPSEPQDAAVDAFASACGHPGDTGNELGVGKFCPTLNDCTDTPDAPLCSSLGDSSTHFCTKTCDANGSADQCGTDASCTCNANNQCGCTPDACLN
jgi:hypothetical protein